MNISIFEEVTTDKVLAAFAEKAESYTGLYVDMNNKDERRMVKNQADDINKILKKLDRARIDKTKESKRIIDDEFMRITTSLKESNKPFTLLIDDYKAERKRILDEEKEVQRVKEAYYHKGIDHADAINENELYDLRKEKQQAQAKERESQILAEAEARRIADIEQAKIDEQNKRKAEAKRIENERLQREADTKHVTSVLTRVKESLMQSCKLTEEQARAVVIAIKNNQIISTSIKF